MDAATRIASELAEVAANLEHIPDALSGSAFFMSVVAVMNKQVDLDLNIPRRVNELSKGLETFIELNDGEGREEPG